MHPVSSQPLVTDLLVAGYNAGKEGKNPATFHRWHFHMGQRVIKECQPLCRHVAAKTVRSMTDKKAHLWNMVLTSVFLYSVQCHQSGRGTTFKCPPAAALCRAVFPELSDAWMSAPVVICGNDSGDVLHRGSTLREISQI